MGISLPTGVLQMVQSSVVVSMGFKVLSNGLDFPKQPQYTCCCPLNAQVDHRVSPARHPECHGPADFDAPHGKRCPPAVQEETRGKTSILSRCHLCVVDNISPDPPSHSDLSLAPNCDAISFGSRLNFSSRLVPPPFQMKALSMTEQFSLPNCQYMISTLATMGFCSKPLLDVCCTKIAGEKTRYVHSATEASGLLCAKGRCRSGIWYTLLT